MPSSDREVFIRVAREFCEFVATSHPQEPPVFLQAVQGHLLTLYQQALTLNWIDLQSECEFDDDILHVNSKDVLPLLSSILDTSRYYWSVFDPTNLEENEVGCSDLLDDLGDIYSALKSSLQLYDSDIPSSKEHAIWQFKFDFDTHWGNHCISALGAIHFFTKAQ